MTDFFIRLFYWSSTNIYTRHPLREQSEDQGISLSGITNFGIAWSSQPMTVWVKSVTEVDRVYQTHF